MKRTLVITAVVMIALLAVSTAVFAAEGSIKRFSGFSFAVIVPETRAEVSAPVYTVEGFVLGNPGVSWPAMVMPAAGEGLTTAPVYTTEGFVLGNAGWSWPAAEIKPLEGIETRYYGIRPALIDDSKFRNDEGELQY